MNKPVQENANGEMIDMQKLDGNANIPEILPEEIVKIPKLLTDDKLRKEMEILYDELDVFSDQITNLAKKYKTKLSRFEDALKKKKK